MDAIDCSSGGAQEAFEARCARLEEEGWTLEKRSFDSRYVHRGADRFEVTIECGPYDAPHLTGLRPQKHTLSPEWLEWLGANHHGGKADGKDSVDQRSLDGDC